MRSSVNAALVFLLAALVPMVAAAVECGAPVAAADGWDVEPDPARVGFHPGLLWEAVNAFAESSRNLHGGENTLISIRAVPSCVRFQPCD